MRSARYQTTSHSLRRFIPWALAIACVVHPAMAEPMATITGISDPVLRGQIEALVAQVDGPPQSRFEAVRRSERVAEAATALLRSEGYYAAVVELDVAETEDGSIPAAKVSIEPGQRFVLGAPRIEWQGSAPDPLVDASTQSGMAIKAGDPGRAADILAAEAGILASLRRAGFADAEAAERLVIVDHAQGVITPTYRIAAGEPVLLGDLALKTTGNTSSVWLANVAPWSSGEPYSPGDVALLEERLLETGAFEAVDVSLGTIGPNGRRQVNVTLAPRPELEVEGELSYATSDGFGVRASGSRYDTLGRGDTQRLGFRLAQREQEIAGELVLPHFRSAGRTLTFGSNIYNRETDAFETRGGGLRATFVRKLRRADFYTWGAEAGFARTEEPSISVAGQTVRREDLTLSGTLGLILDRSDRPFDARRGWRIDTAAEPTLLAGEATTAYAGLRAQVVGYLPAGERTVFAGRLKGAALLGADLADIPSTRRLFAGGGGSVRGFAFQDVGPRLPNGTPAGGSRLIEASVEVRQRLTERVGVVAFVDAGSVGSDARLLGDEGRLGAGFGVRYDFGFAPLRVDVALPLDRQPSDGGVQVYLSIGQSF
jgi:translocation and assembly module TamA